MHHSVYQVNPVSRISGEGRAKFSRTWGPDFDQKGGGRGGKGATRSGHQTTRPRIALPISGTPM